LTTDSQSAAVISTSGDDSHGIQQQQPESTRHDDYDVSDDDVIDDVTSDE